MTSGRHRSSTERSTPTDPFLALAEADDDAYLVVDGAGTVRYANGAVESVLGYDPEGLRGTSLATVLPESGEPARTGGIDEHLAAVEPGSIDGRAVAADGRRVPVELTVGGFDSGDDRRFAVVVRALDRDSPPDRSAATCRERPFHRLAENLDAVVRMSDATKTTMLYVNPAYEEIWGRSVDRLYGDPLDFLKGVHPDDRARVETALDRWPEDGYDEVYRIERPDGAVRWIHDRAVPLRDEAGDVHRFIGIAQDVTRAKRREDALTALSEATRSLIRAETAADVAEEVGRIADEVLDLSTVSVYRFDAATGRLRPAVTSSEATDRLGELPTFGLNDSLAGAAFAAGETGVYDDVRNEKLVYNPETPIRSELVVPLGDHGVLLAGDTAVGVLSDAEVEFAEILARNAEVAFDRAERDRALRERDRALERQNRRLAGLDRINSVIRDVDQALVGAVTREEIERRVCERLTDTRPHVHAWIGVPDRQTGRLEPRTWADGERAEDVSAPLDGAGLDPAVRETVLERHAVAVVAPLDDAPALDPGAGASRRGDPRSVALIPIVFEGTIHGVLAVYADVSNAFDDEVRAVLGELGETIGLAISAAEYRKRLFSDTVVEMELRTADDCATFTAASDDLDCSFRFEGSVRLQEALLFYVTACDATPDAIRRRLLDAPVVKDCRTIRTDGDESLIEVRLGSSSGVFKLVERGARIRSATAISGEGSVTIHLPPETDVREFFDGYRSRYPDAELVSKRSIDRPIREVSACPMERVRALTDRRRTVLRAAYLSGYFSWPRESTVEELADSMGLSAATVHYHLRHALQTVIEGCLEGASFE